MYGPFDFDADNILNDMFMYGEVTGDDILGIHDNDSEGSGYRSDHYDSDFGSDFDSSDDF